MCSKCGIDKLPEFYYKNKNTKTGHSSVCKECNSQYKENRKKKYWANRVEFRYLSAERGKMLLNINRNLLVDYLKKNPCIDCGMKNILCLHFDHRDSSTKSFTISQKMGKYNWEKILKEIDKCDVRCANCHHIKTAHQFNWFKLNK